MWVLRGGNRGSLSSDVNCDNPRSEISPRDFLPARPGHQCGKVSLIRPRHDRFGEIDIGIGIRGEALCDRRERTKQVFEVDGAKQPRGRV